MSTPELIIASQPIDLEITLLLGEHPSDFILLYLDGRKMENFGSPLDTPSNRAHRQGLVDALNDKSKKSLWPEFFKNWKMELRRQFGIGADATAKDFHPVASYKIERVCAGYSQHAYAAIQLFSHPKLKGTAYQLKRFSDGSAFVMVMAGDGSGQTCNEATVPMAIAKAVLMFLKIGRFTTDNTDNIRS